MIVYEISEIRRKSHLDYNKSKTKKKIKLKYYTNI